LSCILVVVVLSCTFVAQKYQNARHTEKAVRRLSAATKFLHHKRSHGLSLFCELLHRKRSHGLSLFSKREYGEAGREFVQRRSWSTAKPGGVNV